MGARVADHGGGGRRRAGTVGFLADNRRVCRVQCDRTRVALWAGYNFVVWALVPLGGVRAVCADIGGARTCRVPELGHGV